MKKSSTGDQPAKSAKGVDASPSKADSQGRISSLESIRQLYLAERERRVTIRSLANTNVHGRIGTNNLSSN